MSVLERAQSDGAIALEARSPRGNVTKAQAIDVGGMAVVGSGARDIVGELAREYEAPSGDTPDRLTSYARQISHNRSLGTNA